MIGGCFGWRLLQLAAASVGIFVWRLWLSLDHHLCHCWLGLFSFGQIWLGFVRFVWLWLALVSQDLPTPLSEVVYLQHYQYVLIKISPIKVVHRFLNLQNQKGMPLYKEFTSEKLSRAQTQCIFKFYMKNRYVIFK